MAKQITSAKTPVAQAAAAMLPPEIEIFAAGVHIDDSGASHNFSEDDVVGMAQCYNPALREAPLCIGHPKDNLPAYGWVSGLALNAAKKLVMNTRQVAASFAEMALSGAIKKRSSSFYPPNHPNNPVPGKWYLRHVAFLGAQQPAVSGLADFSAGSDAGCIHFSEPVSSGAESAALAQASGSASPPPSPSLNPDQLTQEQLMDIDLKKQLEAAQAKQAETDAALAAAKAEADAGKAQLAQFAEKAKVDKTASFVSFAEGVPAQVLLPKDRPMVVAALEALDAAKPVSFAEGGATKTVSPAEWFKTFVTTRGPVVSFGEHAPGTAGAALAGSAAGKTDAEIDAAAKAHMRANKGVNYMDALSAVTFTA